MNNFLKLAYDAGAQQALIDAGLSKEAEGFLDDIQNRARVVGRGVRRDPGVQEYGARASLALGLREPDLIDQLGLNRHRAQIGDTGRSLQQQLRPEALQQRYDDATDWASGRYDDAIDWTAEGIGDVDSALGSPLANFVRGG